MARGRKRKLNTLGKLVIFVILIIALGCGGYFGYKYIKDSNSNNNKETVQPSVSNEESNEPEPEKPKEPEEKRMSIVMVGDALIHGAVYMDAYKNGKYDFSKMLTEVAPYLPDYDLRYYNQESILGGGAPQHYPRLNTPDAFGQNMMSIGFNLVSLANNHSFDKGEAGLKHSLAFWKKYTNTGKVHTAGSYSSFAERDNVPVYEQNGIKYAFLAYTIPTNGLRAPTGKEYYVNVYSKDLVKKHVDTAKKNGAEVIIVSMHWGVEYTHTPNNQQKEVAKYLNSFGVNLVLGAHPHVIQPMEYVGDTLVIYSLGNFISAQRVLGLEKIIGLCVGTDIVVKENKVSFEKTRFELLYTYYSSANRNFKVYPFSRLTNNILNNYKATNTKYRKIVDPKGVFNGN